MWSEYLIDFIDKLGNPPDEISKLIKEDNSAIEYKGYGTPELEMKFLHKLFLQIQSAHPEFETFSWEQCNSYNDNYHHFQLTSFTVNDKLNVCSDIDFCFAYNEEEKISSDIYFDSIEYPDPEEIEYAKENKLQYDKEGLNEQYWNAYWEHKNKKYKYLEIPCLKFLIILKLLEKHFSMYFFLYTFGNGVRIKFNKEGVIVTNLDEKEMDGLPLGDGMDLDEL
jgi:hypothetical protein